MTLSFLYILLINFGLILDLIGISRLLVLASISSFYILENSNLYYIKYIDFIYFLYLFIRISTINNFGEIKLLTGEITFYICILASRILYKRININQINKAVLWVSIVNLPFSVIKLITIGQDEMYLGTFGLSVGEIGSYITPITIFYLIINYKKFIESHGFFLYSISISSMIILGIASEKKFLYIFSILLFIYYTVFVNYKKLFKTIKIILSVRSIFILISIIYIALYGLRNNPEVKHITETFSANYYQFAYEYVTRSMDNDSASGLYKSNRDSQDKSEGRFTIINKCFNIIKRNPNNSYGLGTFSFASGLNRTNEQLQRLDIVGAIPTFWKISLESSIYAGLTLVAYIISSFINHLNNIRRFSSTYNKMYFAIIFMFLIDIFFYSESTFTIPPLNVLVSSLFI